MRVLVINGSPKGERSNTWQLTRAFLAGITEQLGEDALEVRTVETRNADIHPCLGCFTCWRNEEGLCCLHDDTLQETTRALGQLLFPRQTFEAMAGASWTSSACAIAGAWSGASLGNYPFWRPYDCTHAIHA